LKPTKHTARRQNGVPTIADVSKRAGVSSMTVSRVINGDAVVREETREKVMAAIKALNYIPNAAARSLAAADHIKIALFYSNPSASYLSEFLVGILEGVDRSNTQLVLEKSEGGEHYARSIERIIQARIDGTVLPPPICDDQAVIDRLVQAGITVVTVGAPNTKVSSVNIDDRQAAEDMTDHIIALGHRHIGFILGNPNHIASRARFEGYLASLTKAGIAFDASLMAKGDYSYTSGIESARALMNLSPRPTAIFASNDEMAAAVVAVAHQMGLDVPTDITVCGFDDTLLSTTIWPTLTTIHQPIVDMSREAVDLLTREIRAKRAGVTSKPEQTVLNYRLIVRESDSAPPKRIRLAKPRRDDPVA